MEIYDLSKNEIVKFINLTRNCLTTEEIKLYASDADITFTLAFNYHEKANHGTSRTIKVVKNSIVAIFLCSRDEEIEWLGKWSECDFLDEYYSVFRDELWSNDLPF